MIELFNQTYNGESIVDLYRDVEESIDSKFNPLVNQIPKDEYGFQKGKFLVKIEWIPEE